MFAKVAVFLVLFAIVNAQGFGSIVVDTQDGDTVVINKNTDQKVRIATNPLWGEGHTIKVQVAGPAVPPKTVHIADHQVDFAGTKQSDVLNKVLDAFNGHLGEESYKQLLKTIAQKVVTGKVHPIVLDALETASNDEDIALPGAQKLIQKVIQKQGAFGEQWQQDPISEILGLKKSKKEEELKKALICQAFGECGPLAGAKSEWEAEMEAKQAARALGIAGPRSQFTKQAIFGKRLGGYESPLEAEREAQILKALARQGKFEEDITSPFAKAYDIRGFGGADKWGSYGKRTFADSIYGRGLETRGPRSRLTRVLGIPESQKEAFGEF